MTASARAIAIGLSLSLLMGTAWVGAMAAEPDGKPATQHAPHKKPSSGNPGVKQKGDNGQQYAKRGNCTRCPPERIQKKTLQPPKPRNAKATPQAKHATATKPDNDPIPLPVRCQYADPEEPGSEALKIECNKANYPTPRWPKRGAPTADPQPTPDDRSFPEKVRDDIGLGDKIRSESAKAHSQQPDCSNAEVGSAQDVNDILSGCQ